METQTHWNYYGPAAVVDVPMCYHLFFSSLQLLLNGIIIKATLLTCHGLQQPEWKLMLVTPVSSKRSSHSSDLQNTFSLRTN